MKRFSKVILVGLLTVGLGIMGLPQEKKATEKPNDSIEGISKTAGLIYQMVLEELDDENNPQIMKFFRTNFPEIMKEIDEKAQANEREDMAEFLLENFEEYLEFREELQDLADEEADWDEDSDEEKKELAEERKNINKEFNQWVEYKKKEFNSIILGREIRRLRASGKDPERLKTTEAALKTQLKELFDLNNLEAKQEVEELEKEIKEMKRIIEKREKNRDQVINRRFNVLTEEDEDEELEW